MEIKYVVRPGFTYNHDGYCYKVTAADLMRLYDVHPRECVVLENKDVKFTHKLSHYISLGYVFLYPRSDSNYGWLKQRQDAC